MCACMCTHTCTVTLPVFSVVAFYLGHCYNLHPRRRRRRRSRSSPGQVKATLSLSESVPIRAVRRHPTHTQRQLRCVCECLQHFVTFKCNLCNSRRSSTAPARDLPQSESLPRVRIDYTRCRCRCLCMPQSNSPCAY